jgi:hypothetical protein
MLDAPTAGSLAGLICDCLHREYPNKIAHYLDSDADLRPPRELTPAFFGAFDWHSAVHGHWALVRLLRRGPGQELGRARTALATSLTPERIAGELAYLAPASRRSFEMPYGVAWLLLLDAELAALGDTDAARWRAAVAPLAELLAGRFADWLDRLPGPVRTGEHNQSAFAMTLVLDAARATGRDRLAAAVTAAARRFHAGDRDAPLAYEPSAFDFLSPALGQADLLRRILDPAEFLAWWDRFAPGLGRGVTLEPVGSPDPSDGKLAHRDGLNLSRAWMLAGVASALPEADPRRPALERMAARHGEAGLAAIRAEHYAGAHWLGTFGVYWLTREAGFPATA